MADFETDDLRQLSKHSHTGDNGEQVDLSDETQDFRFLGMFAQSGAGGAGGGKKSDPTLPKRGEKDFAPDGTDLQSRILDDSRAAMHNALSGTREHTSRVHVHITWRAARGQGEVRAAKGSHFKNMGRADTGGVVWLEREEVLYLVERGGVECWWEEGVPMSLQGCYAECLGGGEGVGWLERYQVYAYLKRAGYIVQRAPTFLCPNTSSPPPHPQPPSPSPPTSTYHPPSHPPLGLFPTLFHNIFHRPPAPSGPLIKPRTPHRSYSQIYPLLSLTPSHHPSLSPSPSPRVDGDATSNQNRLNLTFHVWKPQPHFKKSDPPPPDFRVVVVSVWDFPGVLALGDVEGLFDSVPVDVVTPSASLTPTPTPSSTPAPGPAPAPGEGDGGRESKPARSAPKGPKGPRPWAEKTMMSRLKEGRKGVVLAVVDRGVISFVRVGDVGFGEERVWEEGARGGKGKGGGKGRGKGGAGGAGGGGAGVGGAGGGGGAAGGAGKGGK